MQKPCHSPHDRDFTLRVYVPLSPCLLLACHCALAPEPKIPFAVLQCRSTSPFDCLEMSCLVLSRKLNSIYLLTSSVTVGTS